MAFLAQLDSIDGRRLSLLQRLLLVNDGTLTDAVEMAFLEPIQLVKLGMEICPAEDGPETLEAEAGMQLMRRRILLRGEHSGRNFVHAESWIVIDRLPHGMREQLTGSENPIGRLWAEYKLETRKEILRFWRQAAGDLGIHFGIGEDGELVARSYRVVRSGRPLMLITEYFPASN